MHYEELQNYLNKAPFIPFRIHLTNGVTFDVRHPEMVLVSRRVITVAIYKSDDLDIPETVRWCDPIHITHLEPLENGKSVNGHRRKKK